MLVCYFMNRCKYVEYPIAMKPPGPLPGRTEFTPCEECRKVFHLGEKLSSPPSPDSADLRDQRED